MLRQGSAARDLRTVGEMRAHAKAVAHRMDEAAARRVADEAERRRALEARAVGSAPEADDIAVAPSGDAPDPYRAAFDAQVFQILDPEALAREPKRIIARTAVRFGLTRDDVLGLRRHRPIVRARWASIAAVKAEHPTYSLPRLGRIFGRDHTTILHALRRMAEIGVRQPPGGPVAS